MGQFGVRTLFASWIFCRAASGAISPTPQPLPSSATAWPKQLTAFILSCYISVTHFSLKNIACLKQVLTGFGSGGSCSGLSEWCYYLIYITFLWVVISCRLSLRKEWLNCLQGTFVFPNRNSTATAYLRKNHIFVTTWTRFFSYCVILLEFSAIPTVTEYWPEVSFRDETLQSLLAAWMLARETQADWTI